jgi:prefoldin alpha subunit
MSAKKSSRPAKIGSESEFQEMVYLYQLLRDQHGMLKEQIEYLEQQIAGINLSKVTLDGLKGTKADQEVIIPLGTMAFVKAKLDASQKIMVTISKDIVIEKSIEDGAIYLEKNLDNMTKLRQKFIGQIQEIGQKMQELEPQINAMYSQYNKGP